MPDNNSYMNKMQKAQKYPKRNLVWGRDVPTQGNISTEDMLDYLPNNYQDMERPTSPVPGDILRRYGPDVQQRNAPTQQQPIQSVPYNPQTLSPYMRAYAAFMDEQFRRNQDISRNNWLRRLQMSGK